MSNVIPLKPHLKNKIATGIYWFTNDLRVHDNEALAHAANKAESLVCIFIVEPSWFKPNRYGLKTMGASRWRFLHQSLSDLDTALRAIGQSLIVLYESPVDAIATLITQTNANAVFRSANTGYYENQHWQSLRQRYPFIEFEQQSTHTLFSSSPLSIDVNETPPSFSKFRKKTEKLPIQAPHRTLEALPPQPKITAMLRSSTSLPNLDDAHNFEDDRANTYDAFKGGASQAHAHIDRYFQSSLPANYKIVRNALDGFENSTKFSPWLANGCISGRRIIAELTDYETNVEKNDSTYWIKFELLWREYFHWLAAAAQTRLFSLHGIKQTKPLTSFYPERFQRWCSGNTPWPLVNACMKQLNATGFMSNRGRQIVASCLVNELNLDWRYGAAYFEQQLIDYDVASNWGNWQYLAGVGTDSRGKRHFDIAKQTAQYDPESTFIRTWIKGETPSLIDSVDAADWPIAD